MFILDNFRKIIILIFKFYWNLKLPKLRERLSKKSFLDSLFLCLYFLPLPYETTYT